MNDVINCANRPEREKNREKNRLTGFIEGENRLTELIEGEKRMNGVTELEISKHFEWLTEDRENRLNGFMSGENRLDDFIEG